MLASRNVPVGLDILDNDIFYNLYVSETYILYSLLHDNFLELSRC